MKKPLYFLSVLLVFAGLLALNNICWAGWATGVVDSTRISFGGYISIALSTNNYTCIAYSSSIAYSEETYLKYATWTGASWSTQTVDSSLNKISLAIDSNNNPHIAYAGRDSLKYAKWTGASWSTQTVDFVGSFYGKPSMALDSSNNPHIAYAVIGNSIKYAKWTGASWSTQTIDSTSYNQCSIAIDNINNPHIAYGG
ncbi:MAG: hypothetical protein KKG87_01460, partial [Elusimicrobia bacterium]|nr:hypothetical protein [Elusimicrobiota bacterium]